MLHKSTKSAIVMAGIACLSALLTVFLWEWLRWQTGTSTSAPGSSSPARLLLSLFAILIVMLIFVVLPAAFLIRNWSDQYFGPAGAARWVLFGVILGTLAQARTLLPEIRLESELLSFLLEKALSIGLGLLFLWISHFLAFRRQERQASGP
jgi:hypothetical protein